MLRFRHVISTSATTLVGGALSLLLAFVCARILNPTENGHYAQFLLIMNLIYIGLNFGLGAASTYHIASGLRTLPDLLSLNFRFVGVVALFCLLVGVILSVTSFGVIVSKYFKVPLSLIFLGMVAGVMLIGLNQVGAIFMGLHHYDQANIFVLMKALVPLPMVFVAGLVIGGEVAISWAQTIALVVVLVFAVRSLFALDGAKSHAMQRGIRDMLGYGSLAYLANLFHFAAMRGLLLFISFYTAPDQVGFFNLSLLLLEATLLLPSAIGQLMFPKSSSPTFDHSLVAKLLRLNLYLGFLVAAIIIFSSSMLLDILLGAAYSPVGDVFFHMAPAVILMTLPRVLSQVLSGSGHPIYPLVAAILSSMVCVVLAFLWIPSYGVLGAAWVINSVALITAIVTIYGYCRIFDTNPLDLLTPRISDLSVAGDLK